MNESITLIVQKKKTEKNSLDFIFIFLDDFKKNKAKSAAAIIIINKNIFTLLKNK